MNAMPETLRVDLKRQWPEGMRIMAQFDQAVRESGLDAGLMELVKIRASQINRCAFCINMHTREARKRGETEQRIALLPAFEEAPCYSDAEKAALGLAEALTEPASRSDRDGPVARAAQHFEPPQLARLVFAITLINAWNRLSIADRFPFALESRPLPRSA